MKLSKKEVVSLLKQKEEKHMTFAEISKLSGYHPKYLINLNKQLQEGTIILEHQNKGRKPVKTIFPEEEKQILNLFHQKYYEKLTDFYDDYLKSNPKPVRKYITINKFIHKHLETMKPKEKFIYINYIKIKGHRYYYAFSYPEEKLIFVNSSKNIYEAMTKLLRVIKLPKNIVLGFEPRSGIYYTNVKRILDTLNIHILPLQNFYIDLLDRNMKKRVLSGKYKLEVVPPNREYDSILALHTPMKTNEENSFTYQKKNYMIETDIMIPKGSYIFVITNPPSKEIRIKYNNKLYKTNEKK